MGSPVSVAVADLDIENVEQRAQEFFGAPKSWYVDDTYTVHLIGGKVVQWRIVTMQVDSGGEPSSLHVD